MREAIEQLIRECGNMREEINVNSIRALDEVNNLNVQFLGTLYRGQYQGIGMILDKLKEILANDPNHASE